MVQGVIYYDAALQIIGVNPAAEQILGQLAENLIGRTVPSGQWFIIREYRMLL